MLGTSAVRSLYVGRDGAADMAEPTSCAPSTRSISLAAPTASRTDTFGANHSAAIEYEVSDRIFELVRVGRPHRP
ncbi:hypothetical protein SMICM304S_08926 [Streptomyces microflavus]